MSLKTDLITSGVMSLAMFSMVRLEREWDHDKVAFNHLEQYALMLSIA
jgi:hypothetical protein